MDDAAQRAQQRQRWPIRRHRLTDEVTEDISDVTTAEERLAMVWPLTLQAWRLAGREVPRYRRNETPGRVIRRSEPGDGTRR